MIANPKSRATPNPVACSWYKGPLLGALQRCLPTTCLCVLGPAYILLDAPSSNGFLYFSGKSQQVCFSSPAFCLWYSKLQFSVRDEPSSTYLFPQVHIGFYIHMCASICRTKRIIQYEITAKLEVQDLYLSEWDRCQDNKHIEGTNSLLEHSCLPGHVWGRAEPPLPTPLAEHL